jgi:uncharacterized protein YdhG (YjbR/CyaY superfamily)
MTEIDDALNGFDPAQSRALLKVRQRLQHLLPTATQDMSWGMPTFRIEGILVVSLMGFTHHNSLFPGAEVQERLGPLLEGYNTTKGTIHFEKEKAPPVNFLRALVRARIDTINASYPKKSGEFLEFYDHGGLKAKGRYREGEMTGQWSFFRRNGTMLRSGTFRSGVQTGLWTTYDSSGAPYKTTALP